MTTTTYKVGPYPDTATDEDAPVFEMQTRAIAHARKLLETDETGSMVIGIWETTWHGDKLFYLICAEGIYS